MAKLIYNARSINNVVYNMPNELLVTLQCVMNERFKDGEGFWLEFEGDAIWIHPTIPLQLTYDDASVPYSQEAMHKYLEASKGPFGLSLGDESLVKRVEVVDPEWQRPAAADAD